ncbi:chromosome-associated kinesin KIF4-like [Drosophila pseudoobscura]|uniref:Chromosome-associated kinesin KIF4-like n=1 Tax=Drosophila pseudoobscura pseudoobscura TaxID=46245 RepID=A0A6I8W6U1_DROPS|nr:chromosome-associated kinesin KIF4 [Drosophila pseudoobscura]
MSSEDTSTVAVALRVRPLVKSEVESGCRIALERSANGSPQVSINRGECFTYNHVFDINDTQKDLFEACVQGKLKKLLDGYNVTIIAYGQTGSGKTYTMGTAFNGVLDEDVGVIPRAVDDIFGHIAELKEEYQFKVTCSFVELYQEQFFDLFSPHKREKSTVDLREIQSRIVLPGLTELDVKSARDAADYLMRGSAGRAVAATAMNETSSRSHAIFTLTVVSSKLDGGNAVTTSKFNLVDLAGSERCSKTLTMGDRFKEGVNINKGLLALGNVINALGSGQVSGYIPYRQSKLTHLLKDSLGGNSITLMIACVSPADYNVSETLSTLRYADRALQIKNKPVVNMDPHTAEVNMLKDIIQKLRVELLGVGKMSSSINCAVGAAGLDPLPSGADGTSASSTAAADQQGLKDLVKTLQEKTRKLQQELHQALIDLTEKEMRAHIAEAAHDKLKAYVIQLKSKLQAQLPGDGAEPSEPTDQMREISQLVDQVDEELQRTEEELQTNGYESRSSNRTNGDGEGDAMGEEAHELLNSQSEDYTKKQLGLVGELRTINRQLDLKQELHERICRNFSKLDDDDDEKVKQCNQKIDELENERRDLIDQLRTIKSKDPSARIAEERRKRLQLLEVQIAELRRKLITQANMLKMREKEREKINNLSAEIRAMKESKVKLIRTMRGESEKFRQWRTVREKELTQLKSKDRKMQSEMVRQQTLHTKQRQVLKRKCEEALAANKRLKDALDRQASAQRQRHAKDPTGGAKTDSWVERELEVILSVIDAEHSLEQLMEDRAIINSHYNQVKSGGDPKQLAMIEEELEMRSAQIADLQQKVCLSDLDSRSKALAESVQSINESRAVSKQLLKSLVQQRRQQAHNILEQRIAMEEQRCQLLETQQRHEALAKRLRQVEAHHEEQMLAQQRAYEEKVAVLLRTAATHQPAGESHQEIIEELLSSREALQQQFDRLKSSKEKTNTKEKQAKAAPSRDNHNESVEFLSETIEIMSDASDASDDDPEWIPSTKRRSKMSTQSVNDKTERATSQAQETSMPTGEEQQPLAANSEINGSVNSQHSTSATEVVEGGRHSISKKCKCRTKCNTKRCACFSSSNGCGDNCGCKGSCMNPLNRNAKPQRTNSPKADILEIKEEPLEEQKQEDVKMVGENSTFASPEPAFGSESAPTSNVLSPAKRSIDQNAAPAPLGRATSTEEFSAPKLARMSGLAFSTPRRKFF